MEQQKSGWLAKHKQKGAHVLPPDKRFFVLTGSTLSWFAKYKDSKLYKHPKNSVDLRFFSVRHQATSIFLTPNIDGKLGEALRSYELVANSEDEAKDWTRALTLVTSSAPALLHHESFWGEVDECFASEQAPKRKPTAPRPTPPSSNPARVERSTLPMPSHLPSKAELIAHLRAHHTLLPPNLDHWYVDDLRALHCTLDGVVGWFAGLEGAEWLSTTSITTLGAPAFDIVRRAFTAHHPLPPVLVHFASLYVQFVLHTTKVFEGKLREWCLEYKAVEARDDGNHEERLNLLAVRILDAENEIAQAQSETQLHSLVGMTLLHLLNHVGRLSEDDENFARCYLAWVQDADTFAALSVHCNNQLHNLEVFIAGVDQHVGASEPLLLQVHESVRVAHVYTTQQQVVSSEWGAALQQAQGAEDLSGVRRVLSATFAPAEVDAICNAGLDGQRTNFDPARSYHALLNILAQSLTATLQHRVEALCAETAVAGSEVAVRACAHDAGAEEAKGQHAARLPQRATHWDAHLLVCTATAESLPRVLAIANVVAAKMEVVGVENLFDPATRAGHASPPPHQITFLVVVRDEHSPGRRMLAQVVVALGDSARASHQLLLYRDVVASKHREGCARKFAGLGKKPREALPVAAVAGNGNEGGERHSGFAPSPPGPNTTLGVVVRMAQGCSENLMKVWERRRSQAPSSPLLDERLSQRVSDLVENEGVRQSPALVGLGVSPQGSPAAPRLRVP